MSNKLREVLAQTVSKNGGYGSYALEWNVSCPFSVEDFQHYISEKHFSEHIRTLKTAKDKKIFAEAVKIAAKEWNTDKHKQNVWDWVTEDMARSFEDDDGMRALSPEIAAKWSVSDDKYFDVKWEFHGRGGKHLVLASFEGYTLSNTFADDLTDDGENFPNSLVSSLIAFIEEYDKVLDRKNVEAEFEYQVCFMAAQSIENAWAEATEVLACRKLEKTIKAVVPILGAERVLALSGKAVLTQINQV